MKKPFFALWILTLALFVFSWVYLPGISKYRDLKIKQEQIESEIKVLEDKLKSVREERDLLKNDVQYLEKVIRDELGLVKPGEVVYKFVPEQPKPAAPAEAKKEETPAPAKTPAKPAESVALPPSVTIKTLNEAAEGQIPTPIASPGSEEAKQDISVAEPSENEEPVYPRQETR